MEKQATILLIDDDEDFIESTRMVLESRPYTVITAADGEAGLRRAREERPDLILLDVIMPLANGFTVARKLKEEAALAGIPVVMLTSYAARGAGTGIPRSQGYDLDAEDYLNKPVPPAILLAAVQKHLKK